MSRLFAGMLVAAGLGAPWLAAAPFAPRVSPDPPGVERPAVSGVVPRAVLALWDSAYSPGPRFTNIHEFIEMPLNHLGLIVRYQDIRRELPALDELGDVRGVLTWFTADAMPDPQRYLRWLESVARSGRHVVILGPLGVSHDEHGETTPLAAINRVLGVLGWRYDAGWISATYAARYTARDRGLMDFERPLPAVAPPYARVVATAADAHVALHIRLDHRAATDSDLVIITPRGAYVAPGYGAFAARIDGQYARQWYLNPFEFFRMAFAADEVPKPDTTTLSGRRIFYSHVDGDGWRNMTQVEPFQAEFAISARVVLEDIIRQHPDLPVSVAAIAGDLDPAWYGTSQSLDIARAIYAEPQVEAAIHTYSHPLQWGRFDPTARAAGADDAPEDGLREHVVDMLDTDAAESGRSYTIRPWSLKTEIDGAAAFVDGLLPPGKRVDLIQWSGDTRVFEQAVARARALGLANINGGDTRFDEEFPSVAWVAPLGVRAGRELQVFASNSNENTYTDLWHDRFYGFKYLASTVRNTGSPRRLKPFDIYYHMYSGERQASLGAVLANLAYARSLELAPIETGRFSRIVDGFFSASFDLVAPRTWAVRDRGALQTVRFDHASLAAVDFARSRGVVGQRHALGSLYVALDETAATPVVALKTVSSASREPREPVAYLVESRWRVFDLERGAGVLRFVTQGFGPGSSTWEWPAGDRVVVRWQAGPGHSGEYEAPVDADGRLTLRLPQLTGERVDVTVETVTGRGHGG